MEVKPADRRPLGRTGLQVSPVCIGTSPLASMPALYGYEVAGDRAEATILAALRSPFNFMDTSNNYGGGSAERRIGRALASAGGVPPGFVLATKVDADPDTGDFSGERVKRSVQESLERLGLRPCPADVPARPGVPPHVRRGDGPARSGRGPHRAARSGRAGSPRRGRRPVRLMREFIATGHV